MPGKHQNYNECVENSYDPYKLQTSLFLGLWQYMKEGPMFLYLSKRETDSGQQQQNFHSEIDLQQERVSLIKICLGNISE